MVPCRITLLQYYKKRNATMPRKPIDRDAVRRADAKLGIFAYPPKYVVHYIFGGICKNPQA